MQARSSKPDMRGNGDKNWRIRHVSFLAHARGGGGALSVLLSFPKSAPAPAAPAKVDVSQRLLAKEAKSPNILKESSIFLSSNPAGEEGETRRIQEQQVQAAGSRVQGCKVQIFSCILEILAVDGLTGLVGLDILCLGATLSLDEVELDGLPGLQVSEAVHLHGGLVHEDLLRGVVLGRDDPPALFQVEELDHARDLAELLQVNAGRSEAEGGHKGVHGEQR